MWDIKKAFWTKTYANKQLESADFLMTAIKNVQHWGINELSQEFMIASAKHLKCSQTY